MSEGELPIAGSAIHAARELRVVLGRLQRRIRDAADVRELTPSQAAALRRLSKDGAASTSDLAAAENIRPQSMAAIIAALGERRMIERRPDPHDARRNLVSLSEAGSDYVTGRRAAGEGWLARTLHERFTDAERGTLLRAISLLERLAEP
jgi:DNA-binding MarR family transcriptional regulator